MKPEFQINVINSQILTLAHRSRKQTYSDFPEKTDAYQISTQEIGAVG